MVSFNKTIQAGNLTRDPELRFTNDGIPVCEFGIAVNNVRGNTDHVNFFDVTVWRELGETVANYKKKGDPILVEGRLQYRSWEDRESGQKRSKVDIVAENVQFLGRGNSENGSDSGSGGGSSRSSRSGGNASGGQGGQRDQENVEDDEFSDIPF